MQAANKSRHDQELQGTVRVYEEEKVFRWAEEYYLLDDKEAEQKRKEEWEKAERERRKQAAERIKNMQERKAAPIEKKESDGQISLFDLGKQNEEKDREASADRNEE